MFLSETAILALTHKARSPFERLLTIVQMHATGVSQLDLSDQQAIVNIRCETALGKVDVRTATVTTDAGEEMTAQAFSKANSTKKGNGSWLETFFVRSDSGKEVLVRTHFANKHSCALSARPVAAKASQKRGRSASSPEELESDNDLDRPNTAAAATTSGKRRCRSANRPSYKEESSSDEGTLGRPEPGDGADEDYVAHAESESKAESDDSESAN